MAMSYSEGFNHDGELSLRASGMVRVEALAKTIFKYRVAQESETGSS